MTRDHLKLPGHLLITKGAALSVVVSWLAIAACAVFLVVQNRSLADEQDRTQALALATARTASETCRSEKLLRGVVVGIALNQPNLDRRLVTILEQTLTQLPQRCP